MFVNLFAWWVAVASALALGWPGLFTWFSGPLITLGLGTIMLGMGLSLQVEQLRAALAHPGRIALGVALQFSVMPLLGWGLGHSFGLPAPFAVGLALVACCPGGTASNVIAYLARADVALSVAMTATSTALAAVATPVLTTLTVGSRVDVDAWGLVVNTAEVVVVPVAAGLAMRRWLAHHPALPRLLQVAPAVAVIAITLIVASVIGASRAQILAAAPSLLGAVVTLHALGFGIAYGLGRFLVPDRIAVRTLSIEVGMQNSGLGVVLARGNFPDPLVAIPSALSSLVHSLIGSLLAARWRRSIPGATQPSPRAPG